MTCKKEVVKSFWETFLNSNAVQLNVVETSVVIRSRNMHSLDETDLNQGLERQFLK